jgi:hypothetical protein
MVLSAILGLVGSQGYAQVSGASNAASATNGVGPVASVGPNTPFASAILDHPGVRLPEQGPWTISTADLQQPNPFIDDLAQQNGPMFLFLWKSLSDETRSALQQERAKMGIPGQAYKPGPGLQGLVANLNKLIQGRSVYDEQSFATIKPYLSGDTVKLLNQPASADAARLNRLLLEDAFLLDIRRRPKILFDSDSKNFIFINFAEKIVSLYGQNGKKEWTADLSPSLEEESGLMPYFRSPGTPASNANVGLWDVLPQPGVLRVRLFRNHFYRVDLSTGAVTEIPHL